MKSFIFDHIIKKVKKYSENLEVKNILCEKPWIVFNDTGEKEVFIFRTDGTVLVTKNGEGVITKWEWIPTNKSLMINKIEQEKSIVILRPAFVNKTILALEKDGTNQYSFLIDENNQQSFAPKTLSELQNYFEQLERRAIETEEKNRIKQQEEKKRKELEEKAEDILSSARFGKSFLMMCLSLISLAFALFSAKDSPIATAILMLVSFILFCLGIYIPIRKANNYKKNHPEDHINKYL